jgi:hypothetical protein
MTKRTEATICILAALFVLLTFLIDLRTAFGLTMIFLFMMAVYKLSEIEMKKRNKVF